ncbi:MAG TPA: GAF domain-containing sensor histidine kinase [Anaerolineales bacterium]|nr:GAF domain-containing sensor histidine kinase [Anaerolineales bacterium]
MFGFTGDNATLVSAIILGTILVIGVFVGYIWAQRNDGLRSRIRRPPVRMPRERLRAIYNLTVSLTNTLNYERVLDIALDMSTTAFAEPGAPQNQLVSAVLLFDEDRLVVQTARRFTSADTRHTFPGMDGAISKAIHRGESTLVMNPSSDPEMERVVALRACNAAYLIPLRSGLDVYGLLLFAHPERGFFEADNREILDIIAAQAISAMENARLYNELEQEKERMADAQEEARRKLARDLHDGPTQSVSAIAMRVNFARRLMDRDLAEAGEELYKIEDLARKTTKEIRHMLFTLRPLVLESQGLQAALEAMAEKVNETYNQNVLVEIDENTVEVLDIARLGVIFYIVEEAVNNARKHARADHIWIRLSSVSTEVGLLEIEDDGVGFDVTAVNMFYDSRGSLGLYTLKERSELINGVIQVDSLPGKGTHILVYIPFSETGIERLRQGRR